MSPNPKLIDKWLASLPREARRAISGVIAAADASDTPLYLVGGPLRDLLLGHPSLDIDLVVDGDAIEFARRAARYPDAAVKTHPTFGTATIALSAPTGVGAGLKPARPGTGALSTRIDIATARTETYAHPGALPRTTPAPIEQDLLRRDFTINALALHLNGPHRGALLDPTGGLADLDSRLIRALHDRSFQDDPTRILRATRYAARFDFAIEKQTRTWIKRDVGCLGPISGTRVRNELGRVLTEPAPETVLTNLGRWGALHAIHPSLSFGEQRTLMFESLRRLAPEAAPTAGWTLLAWSLGEGETESLGRRLSLTSRQSALVAAAPRMREIEQRLASAPPSRSGLVTLLSPYPLSAIWALAAVRNPRVRKQCLDYLTTARHIRPILRGNDLIALGVPRGPTLGEMLTRLRAAKLDGEVQTKTDEIRLVQTILKVGDLKGGMVVGQRLACEESTRAGL